MNVPSLGQRTILGPSLFLEMFDDLDDGNGLTRSYNFADDKKIAFTISKLDDSHHLHEAINNLFV